MPAHAAPLLHIRSVKNGDARDVAALLTLLGYPCQKAEALQRIRAIAAEADQALLIAERSGQVCGMLALDAMYYLPLGTRICRITALAVLADHQGQGIGHELLQAAEAWARQAGARRIEATSAAHRERAHAFYRTCGYSDGALRFVKHLGDA
ncbi:MAG: GNAT family N-acetyltransferase [Proteobacteria bacterium]|nr:GNAT family N-acetyltransferase [Pseudomonadota bacterium]